MAQLSGVPDHADHGYPGFWQGLLYPDRGRDLLEIIERQPPFGIP